MLSLLLRQEELTNRAIIIINIIIMNVVFVLTLLSRQPCLQQP